MHGLSIVLYRLSTSNHNHWLLICASACIVLYRLSTSNHNLLSVHRTGRILSYIVFLHQTTTRVRAALRISLLSYIVFLHQTTTHYTMCSEIEVLSYIVFLHQTTTTILHLRLLVNCLISSFYIKPQHFHILFYFDNHCLISSFYIKPQPHLYIHLILNQFNHI